MHLRIAKGSCLWSLLVVAVAPQICGQIRVLAVTSSAGFVRGMPGPGSLATIFCTGLTGINGTLSAQELPLPRTIAGVRVTFSGLEAIDAPLLAVADLGGYQQINLQVPWEARYRNVVTVSQGASSDVATYEGLSWGQFFVDAAGYVVAQHAADYRLVTAANPARPSEWIIAYGSSFGPVAGQPRTGAPAFLDQPSPLYPGAPVPWQFSVYLRQPGGDIRLEMNFIGLAPGTVGVYQVNFRMPDRVAPGEASFYVQRHRICGFFLVQGCGRGVQLDVSARPKLHVISSP